MARELDRRDPTINRMTDARESRLRSLSEDVSDRLPGDHRLRIESFDPATGNPAVVASEAAPAEAGNYVQRALSHLQSIGGVLGFSAAQPAEYAPDPNVQRTSSGAAAVHLQQKYKGLPIFQATETVRFAPDGSLSDTAGSSFSVEEEQAVQPRHTVREAVLAAAGYVAEPHADELEATDQFGEPLSQPSVDLAGFEPTVIAAFPDQPEQSTVLAAGPFGADTRAGLTWFPLDGGMRLAWEVLLTMPEYQGQYRVLVDAETEEVLYCKQLIHTATARGNVFTRDGAGARQSFDFPRALADYGLPVPANLPADFPDGWIELDSTQGNCVRAHLGANGSILRGQTQAGVVQFNPAQTDGDDQKVLNIFYYNCFMHDYFYLLGFREEDGNFQHDNFGRGGVASDRVDARAHSGAVFGTANMATPVDGGSPVMNMGLLTSTNRHTAFDASVVFHEFMHGVTNRLVGGPLNVRALEAPQSGGMGEGWGDYVACTVLGDTVVGAWVKNSPIGIRKFRYDSNFPDSFEDLGTGRYNEEHNVGEIWAATLLEANRRAGANLVVQLVVDALKLSPANPSFLDMRDAILQALDDKLAAGELAAEAHATARRELWAAFARFGMGPNARSNGASLTGIVADFNPPVEAGRSFRAEAEATPGLAIPDDRPAGVASTVAIGQSGQVASVRVDVDIPHTFLGDLRVSLTGPGGQTAVLHDRSGGEANDLVRSYTTGDTPALAAFTGREAQGNWTLRVSDHERVDVGQLRRWKLTLELAP